MRWVVFAASFMFALSGVLSFLVDIPRLITALLLVSGAGGIVWTTWFWNHS